MSHREPREKADGGSRNCGAGGGSHEARSLRFIVLLGVVSLFGDVTYEGARGVVGPFLGTLGAGGATVAAVAGLGDLAGYVVRLASGYLTDPTGRHWLIGGLGYAVNLLSVLLLALAWRWEASAGLLVAERFGKAVRSPERNAMLSHAAARVGFGWGFCLHKALDQLGAVAGPLLVSLVLAAGVGYRAAFASLPRLSPGQRADPSSRYRTPLLPGHGRLRRHCPRPGETVRPDRAGSCGRGGRPLGAGGWCLLRVSGRLDPRPPGRRPRCCRTRFRLTWSRVALARVSRG